MKGYPRARMYDNTVFVFSTNVLMLVTGTPDVGYGTELMLDDGNNYTK